MKMNVNKQKLKRKNKMKLIKSLGVLLATTALFAITAGAATNAPVVTATDPANQWSLTLSGNGSTTTQGDAESLFGTTVSLGHTGKLILPLEAGVRQSVSFNGVDGDVFLTTRLYADWTLVRYKSFELLGGASVGIDYGNQSLVWRAAPEVETRLWLKSDFYLFGRVSYGFKLNDGAGAEDKLGYGIGIGVRL